MQDYKVRAILEVDFEIYAESPHDAEQRAAEEVYDAIHTSPRTIADIMIWPLPTS